MALAIISSYTQNIDFFFFLVTSNCSMQDTSPLVVFILAVEYNHYILFLTFSQFGEKNNAQGK
jgi:hypothetical protein